MVKIQDTQLINPIMNIITWNIPTDNRVCLKSNVNIKDKAAVKIIKFGIIAIKPIAKLIKEVTIATITHVNTNGLKEGTELCPKTKYITTHKIAG